MKKLIVVLFVAGWVFSTANQAWAPTSTATVTFSGVITSVVSMSLAKDPATSACTDPTAVRFDTYDDQDAGAPSPTSPGYMYAPKRSLTGKNWHLANIVANGTTNVSLSVSANLTGITNDKLKVWFGGFYPPGAGTPIPGTKSTDWEAMGASKSTTGPFSGVCPFNYQLNVSGVVAGTYSGTIIYTLTQA